MKISNIYTFDFETNNSPRAIAEGRTCVWLWDVCRLKGYKHQGGRTLSAFFDFCNNLTDYSILYAHNLKFDGSFCCVWLLENGYKWADVDKLKELKPGEFCTSIDGMRRFFRVAFLNKKGRVVEFRDSSKKIPGSVESIAKSWGLPILKGSIDYDRDLTADSPISDEDVQYIEHDTEIIARVLAELYAKGMTSLTASSDTFNAYKKSIGEDVYKAIFPELDLETDNFIRASYFGGFCFVNEKYKERMVEHVNCYDVNSMYPSRMVADALPYGLPIRKAGAPKELKGYDLYITHFKACLKLKPRRFPALMRKSFFSLKNEYITDTDGQLVELHLTNIDFEQMKEHYEIQDIKYIETLYFKSSRNLFKSYILKLYEEKTNGTGAKKQLAKLQLNSLYGKFATNPIRGAARPVMVDGVLKFEDIPPLIVAPIYTALSAFITANSRKFLHDAAQTNYDAFVYCDTDSIHTIGEAAGIEVDKSKLGAWELEKKYKWFKALRQKTYIGELEDGCEVVKVCGAPDAVKQLINASNFATGASFPGKLIPKQVKGGVVLVESNFTIKE